MSPTESACASHPLLGPSGVKTAKLPVRSSDLNAFAERFVRSIRSECLAQLIPLGERHLWEAVKEYTQLSHDGSDQAGGRLMRKAFPVGSWTMGTPCTAAKASVAALQPGQLGNP